MDRYDADLNRQLGDWLREETVTRAPARLVEEVFARTTQTRQARRWWPPASPSRHARPHVVDTGRAWPSWTRFTLAGATAIVLVVMVLGFALRPIGPGPGTTGAPTPSPSPSPELSAAPPPEVTLADGTVAQVLRLGRNAGPIDVVSAFESIWTANIFSHDVSRLDPDTLEESFRIPAGTGPAWFAVTDEALWVTNQTGQGLAPIDPATNLAGSSFGEATPCGAPVLAFDSLWVSGCDSNVILRYDAVDLADIVTGRRFPSNDELITEITAPGYRWLAFAGGRLFTGNAAGVAEVDPTTDTVADLGFCCGDVMGSEGQTIWLNRLTDVARMDPSDGAIVATFPYANAGTVTFEGGRAWLTVRNGGVIEIDLASNAVVRTIPVPGETLMAREADGALWVTLLDSSEIWRIEP